MDKLIQYGHWHISDKGDYDLAIADYSMVIGLHPDHVQSYASRGSTYTRTADFDLAIADFSKVIELVPGNAQAYGLRGSAYMQKEDYGLAITDFNRVIEFGEDAQGSYMLGNIWAIVTIGASKCQRMK